MSLLDQIQCLESERDNARLLAARMRERLEHISNNLDDLESTNEHKTGVNSCHRLTKMVKTVSSDMLSTIQQIICNEEHRYYNLRELSAQSETEHTAKLRGQLSVYKEHYEKLLEEAESDKVELRRRLKEQQDMLLDRDIKIKDLERQIQNNAEALK